MSLCACACPVPVSGPKTPLVPIIGQRREVIGLEEGYPGSYVCTWTVRLCMEYSVLSKLHFLPLFRG
jgi:hypothetical protein